MRCELKELLIAAEELHQQIGRIEEALSPILTQPVPTPMNKVPTDELALPELAKDIATCRQIIKVSTQRLVNLQQRIEI